MGCSASTGVSKSSYKRSIQIITESGKTFAIAYDKELKISQIKNYMEMRIASKSDTLRLFIKVEIDQNKEQVGSQSNLGSQVDYQCKIIQEGGKFYQKIELEDNMLLEYYSKNLTKYACIYLSQGKSLKSSSSNESVSTSNNSNKGQRNQTICINPITNADNQLRIAMEKLENGELMTQSQINILQNYDTTKNQKAFNQANSPTLALNDE